MASSIQDTLRRIQEEAKRRAAQQVADASRFVRPRKPHAPNIVLPKPVEKPSLDDAIATLRENITTAVAQALSTKAARRYIGDVTEQLQGLATAAVANVRADNDFGNAARDEKGIVIYPNNCKLLVTGQKGFGSLVIEEQPQLRTLYGPGGKTFRVPMPYIVFMVGFNHVGNRYNNHGFGVGFGVKPIESVDDRLLIPRLPHTSRNNHVCQPMNRENYTSIKSMAEGIIEVFWNTAFHYEFGRAMQDGGSAFNLSDGRKVRNFVDWEKIGQKNPLDILKGEFGRGDSVRTVLKQFGNIETRDRNTPNNQIQAAVGRLVNGVGATLSADELSKVIQQTAQEIVNVALQNAVGNSALQHEEAVV